MQPFISNQIRPTRITYALWLALQRLLALAFIILALPLIATLWLIVKSTSPGPFLYRQVRPGRNGRPISVLKIRTMVEGADRDPSLALATPISSPQVTRVGRVLRDLKLDELPQLWNVVRGDMAFVGPRPIAYTLFRCLCEKIPGFEQRLAVHPGLTSLGQISIEDNLPVESVVDDWSLRYEAENHYIERQSVWYDLVIMALTAMFILLKARNVFFRRRRRKKRSPRRITPQHVAARKVAAIAALIFAIAGCGAGLNTSGFELSGNAKTKIIRTNQEPIVSKHGIVDAKSLSVPSILAGESPRDYHVGVGDQLKVNVFGETGMTDLLVRVDGSGQIQLPLVENIMVQGLTVLEIKDLLKTHFSDHFKAPWVTAEVARHNSQPVYLLGQFNEAGMVYLDRPTNLLQVLAHGQGISPSADLRGARLIRDGEVLAVDIRRLLRDGAIDQNIWIRANDTVYIPDLRDGRIIVLGEVKNPGIVRMNIDGINVLDAIAGAGGLRDRTPVLSEVRVIRSHSATRGELLIVDVDKTLRGEAMPLELQAGDVVFVPQSAMEDWNDVVNTIAPSLQLVSSSLQPFVQIKFLAGQ